MYISKSFIQWFLWSWWIFFPYFQCKIVTISDHDASESLPFSTGWECHKVKRDQPIFARGRIKLFRISYILQQRDISEIQQLHLNHWNKSNIFRERIHSWWFWDFCLRKASLVWSLRHPGTLNDCDVYHIGHVSHNCFSHPSLYQDV